MQSDIKEHMEVLGSDGQHVGTVDHMDGSATSSCQGRSEAAASII